MELFFLSLTFRWPPSRTMVTFIPWKIPRKLKKVLRCSHLHNCFYFILLPLRLALFNKQYANWIAHCLIINSWMRCTFTALLVNLTPLNIRKTYPPYEWIVWHHICCFYQDWSLCWNALKSLWLLPSFEQQLIGCNWVGIHSCFFPICPNPQPSIQETRLESCTGEIFHQSVLHWSLTCQQSFRWPFHSIPLCSC